MSWLRQGKAKRRWVVTRYRAPLGVHHGPGLASSYISARCSWRVANSNPEELKKDYGQIRRRWRSSIPETSACGLGAPTYAQCRQVCPPPSLDASGEAVGSGEPHGVSLDLIIVRPSPTTGGWRAVLQAVSPAWRPGL